jgi:ATP-binding cassette subfamily B protein
MDRWRCLPKLVRLLWELGPREITLIAAFSLVDGLMPVLAVAALRGLVDSAAGVVRGGAPLGQALRWLLVLMLVSLLQVVLASASGWLGDGVRQQLKARAQERLLAKASRLALAAFEQPEFHDQLHRAQRGLESRLFQTMTHLFPIPSNLATALGLLIYLGTAQPLFPVILLAGLLPIILIDRGFYEKKYLQVRAHTPPERLLHYLDGLMTGREAATEVRLFGLQRYLLERRQALFHALRDERLGLAGQELRLGMLGGIGTPLTLAVVMTGVVALVARGSLSVGYYSAYLSAAERFSGTFYMLFWTVSVLDNDLRYIRDLLEYLDLPEEEKAGAAPPPEFATLRFEAVTFAYPGSHRPVLEEIDLTLHPGERVALVGENGAGKSTLARLLLGLYQPTAGRITVDGADLAGIDPAIWRTCAAAVFQDYVQYQMTARENIGFGDLARLHDAAAIGAAAVKSGADEVVSRLPAGYETVLGKAYEENGQDLSIGQWQKLAIARAYLRDAWVLVLDEPTAALDARAEVEVYRRFREMAAGKTVLFISHRLGSARLADRIVVLEGGRIVEEGSHAELVARQGRYARLYEVQAGWYQ